MVLFEEGAGVTSSPLQGRPLSGREPLFLQECSFIMFVCVCWMFVFGVCLSIYAPPPPNIKATPASTFKPKTQWVCLQLLRSEISLHFTHISTFFF